MSLRDLSWHERGVHDFGAGVPREDGPMPKQTPEGKDWLAGYDEVASSELHDGPHEEDHGEHVQTVNVQILVAGERLVLKDNRGRVIGGDTQSHIVIEQEAGEKKVNATVTFVGLKLVQALQA